MGWRMTRVQWPNILLLALLCVEPAAAATINVGTHELLPNTPFQAIEIYTSGGDEVQGVNFNIQVADGGLEAGGLIDGPAITDVDLITGTIFADNHTVQTNISAGYDWPQFGAYAVTTASGTVAADGLLGTVVIDTTGFFSGTWELRMAGTRNGDTDFTVLPATIFNGQLVLIPEPSGLLLLGSGAAFLACWWRRRQSRKGIAGHLAKRPEQLGC